MNWIVLAVECLALYQLGRMEYWRAFPYFYAKLALVTITYSFQNQYSEAWWSLMWAPCACAIMVLMILATIEAANRFTVNIRSTERRALFGGSALVSGIVLGATIVFRGTITPNVTSVVSAVSFSVECSLATWMCSVLAYDLVSPLKSSRTADAHFILLTMLNVSAALVDFISKFFGPNDDAAWEVAHGMFSCAYCILLLLWSFQIPHLIKASGKTYAHA